MADVRGSQQFDHKLPAPSQGHLGVLLQLYRTFVILGVPSHLRGTSVKNGSRPPEIRHSCSRYMSNGVASRRVASRRVASRSPYVQRLPTKTDLVELLFRRKRSPGNIYTCSNCSLNQRAYSAPLLELTSVVSVWTDLQLSAPYVTFWCPLSEAVYGGARP